MPLADVFGWASLATAVLGLAIMVIEWFTAKHGLALSCFTLTLILKHAETQVLRNERNSTSISIGKGAKNDER